MNIRQQRYKQNRIKGMSQTNAAIAAGYSENTAKAKCGDIEKRANISDVMERKGLTDPKLMDYLIDLLEASKSVKVGDTEVVLNSPEWPARSKGLEMALKLKKHLDGQPQVGSEKSTHIIIVRDGNKTETVARPLCVQQEQISGDVVSMGNREKFVSDLAGNVIQRADS